MSLRTYVFIVGGLIATIGFFALLAPVSTRQGSALGLEVECGTGFAMLDKQAYGNTPGWRATCEDATGTRRAWAWPLLIGGLLVGAGGFVVRVKPEEPAAGPAAAA
ncbi:hypothetical protein [Saccharothrix stipae]